MHGALPGDGFGMDLGIQAGAVMPMAVSRRIRK